MLSTLLDFFALLKEDELWPDFVHIYKLNNNKDVKKLLAIAFGIDNAWIYFIFY